MRKLLANYYIFNSVVTSVSVIMNGDSQNPHFTDAVGKTIPKPFVPPNVASPINLLNPDRYEFYTFNERGELVKRLMTMKEIQSIVANGNGAIVPDQNDVDYNPAMMTPLHQSPGAETKVQDIVDNVQNVLSREIENNKNISHIPSQLLDTPDVSSSWSQILPAIFGNTGDEILPYKQISMVPESEVYEATTTTRNVPQQQQQQQFPTKVPVKYSGTLGTSPSPRPASSSIYMTTSTKVQQPSSSSSTSTTRLRTTSTTTTTTTEAPRTTEVPKTTVRVKETTQKLVATTSRPRRTSVVTSTTTKAPKIASTTKQRVTTTRQPTRPISSTLSKTTTTQKLREASTAAATTTTMQTTTTTTASTPKATTTRKPSRKPTPAIKRPITNSPIVIEKFVRKPPVVAMATTTSSKESEKISEKSAGTVTSTTVKKTTMAVTTTTMRPSATTKVEPTTTTTAQRVTQKVEPALDTKTTLSTTAVSSEEDTRNSAINQIIGSLQQADYFQYDIVNKDHADDKLTAEENAPILREIPTTSTTSRPPSTIAMTQQHSTVSKTSTISTRPSSAAATTVKIFTPPIDDDKMRESIEKLMMNEEKLNGKMKPTTAKTAVVGFDDDIEDIDFKAEEAIYNRKKINQLQNSKTTTKLTTSVPTSTSTTTTTTPRPVMNEDDYTTEPTILSDALAEVIEIMKRNQQNRDEIQSEATTIEPAAEETTELNLTQLLNHFVEINTQQQFASTNIAAATIRVTAPPSTAATKLLEQKNGEATTESAQQDFTTYFFVDDGSAAATNDDNEASQGEFTTEQYVSRSNKKGEQQTTTTIPNSSEEDTESGELVDDVLRAIGLESDEDSSSSSTSKEELLLEKSSSVIAAADKESSDEITNVISSLSSSLDSALSTDTRADIALTSNIADGIITVADTISETLGGAANDDESDEITVTNAKELPRVPTTSPAPQPSTTTILGEITTMHSSSSTSISGDEMKIDPVDDAVEVASENSSLSNDNGESDESKNPPKARFNSTTRPAFEIHERTKTTDEDIASSLVPLNVIRKDNSLEEIDFITPQTPTSTRVPLPDTNYVKIDSIVDTTSSTTEAPKIIGSIKTKLPSAAGENVKSTVVLFKTSSSIPTASTTVALPLTTIVDDKIESKEAGNSNIDDDTQTERVPLIEIGKPSEALPYLSSTEDNLVEVKVQIKDSDTPVKNSSSTVVPSTTVQAIKNSIKNSQYSNSYKPQIQKNIELPAAPKEALGLSASTVNLNSDLSEFAKLCNELAFKFWTSIVADGVSQSRSVIISPFALSSMLSMLFLGARGSTSNEMNDLLKLDDMITFNPHVVFRNISESIEQSKNSGLSTATFVRELFADRAKGKLLPYFKEKAQQFYAAHVEEVNFNVINDVLRRRTNLLVRRHTAGKINEFLKTNNIWVNEPLAAISANVFMVRFECYFCASLVSVLTIFSFPIITSRPTARKRLLTIAMGKCSSKFHPLFDNVDSYRFPLSSIVAASPLATIRFLMQQRSLSVVICNQPLC